MNNQYNNQSINNNKNPYYKARYFNKNKNNFKGGYKYISNSNTNNNIYYSTSQSSTWKDINSNQNPANYNYDYPHQNFIIDPPQNISNNTQNNNRYYKKNNQNHYTNHSNSNKNVLSNSYLKNEDNDEEIFYDVINKNNINNDGIGIKNNNNYYMNSKYKNYKGGYSQRTSYTTHSIEENNFSIGADNNKVEALKINLKVGKGEIKEFVIYQGDDIVDSVNKFCKENNIDFKLIKPLLDKINNSFKCINDINNYLYVQKEDVLLMREVKSIYEK